MSATLDFTLVVKAASKLVYDMFTDQDFLVEWFCDFAEVAARNEGYLFLAWIDGYQASGRFSVAEKPSHIMFNVRGADESADGQVEIKLKEKEGSTEVTLKHTGAGEAWQRLWERGLENMQSHLETGYDLRETRRPLMGVNIGGELTEELIAKRGYPVNKGVLLEGTIENLSAAAAGLKAHDLVVSIAGVSVDDFPAMSKVIRGKGYRAGDSVEVEYYRGAEKHKVTLTFALREVRPIPTPEEYANTLEKLHSTLDAELRGILNGVPEEIAAHRPAKEEWSAREVVAHLIAGQRWALAAISARLANENMPTWSANNTPTVVALAQTYETTADLLNELSRVRRETVSLLRAIPQDFLLKRGTWRRVHEFTDFLQEHDKEHFEQIKKALEAAREPAMATGD
jgi:uncharacterized protein YndB with AHSA1/START domain